MTATPNLDAILGFAQAHGLSVIPRRLMPDGWSAEPTDEVVLVGAIHSSRLGSLMPSNSPGSVHAYERISRLSGKVEEVHAYERDDRLRPGVVNGQLARNELRSFYHQSPEDEAAFRAHLRAAREHLEGGRHDEAVTSLEDAKGVAHRHSFGMVHSELSRQQDQIRQAKVEALKKASEIAGRAAERFAPPRKRLFGQLRPAFAMTATDADEIVGLAFANIGKRVASVAGAKVYGVPVGTVITAKLRKAAQDKHGVAKEAEHFGKATEGAAKGAATAAAKTAAPAKTVAKVAAPAEPAHPDAVGGHKVLGVFQHPESQHAMYDLGHGLHAEGKPGGKPGPVMRSSGLDKAALKEKGWSHTKPMAAAGGVKPPAAKAGGVAPAGGAKPGAPGLKLKPAPAAAKHQRGLAEQMRDYMARQGYKVDPADWTQDWSPQHDDRIWPDLTPSPDFKDLKKPGRVGGTGTAADPIDVKGNVDEALRHIAAGRHVRLNRPAELSLIMQAVNRHAAETEAAGKNDKPDWDFGRLTLKGTNLFTAQNKGIRRIHMPQFSGLAQPGTHAEKVAGGAGKFADLTDEFEQHLKDRGIKVERATMPAAHLKATQTELVGAKVAGFARAFLSGNPKAVKAMSEPIMVTKDGYVVDGHHRWAANMLVDAVDGKLGNDTPMNVRRVDMEIGAMIPKANEWAQQVGVAPAAAVAGDTGGALKAVPKVKPPAAKVKV